MGRSFFASIKSSVSSLLMRLQGVRSLVSLTRRAATWSLGLSVLHAIASPGSSLPVRFHSGDPEWWLPPPLAYGAAPSICLLLAAMAWLLPAAHRWALPTLAFSALTVAAIHTYAMWWTLDRAPGSVPLLVACAAAALVPWPIGRFTSGDSSRRKRSK